MASVLFFLAYLYDSILKDFNCSQILPLSIGIFFGMGDVCRLHGDRGMYLKAYYLLCTVNYTH